MAQFGGMEFQVDDMQWNDLGLVRRLTGEASVRDAAETGQRLVSLWPLTTSLHMDNDVKYAEELQVRLTLQFAKLLVGEPDVAYIFIHSQLAVRKAWWMRLSRPTLRMTMPPGIPTTAT